MGIEWFLISVLICICLNIFEFIFICSLDSQAFSSGFHAHTLCLIFILLEWFSFSYWYIGLCVFYIQIFSWYLYKYCCFCRRCNKFSVTQIKTFTREGVFITWQSLKFISEGRCPRVVKTILKSNKWQILYSKILRLIEHAQCARHYCRHFSLLMQWKVRSIFFNASGTRRISAESVSGYMAGDITNASNLTIHHLVWCLLPPLTSY